MWRSFLCVSLVCGLALDSNTIRSSKESTQQSAELPVRPATFTAPHQQLSGPVRSGPVRMFPIVPLKVDENLASFCRKWILFCAVIIRVLTCDDPSGSQ